MISGFSPRSITQVDSIDTAKKVAEESGYRLKVSVGESPVLSLNEDDEQYLKL
jgi:hypothetical protein